MNDIENLFNKYTINETLHENFEDMVYSKIKTNLPGSNLPHSSPVHLYPVYQKHTVTRKFCEKNDI